MLVIQVNGLQKNFGSTKALNGVNLSVEEGCVYGFIGPNGAGKTTTIRTLLGILRKDGGEARLFGKDPFVDAVELHKRLAYVPGDVSLWPNLTGGEIIDLLGRLHGGIDPKKRAALLERFQLDASKKSRTYSKGNRQKVALVAALACEAELYLLDEPTSGLDPLMERTFQECVGELKQAGKTIFLSSHILSEVETLCDRVGIIKGGKIVDSGSLSEMRHLTHTRLVVRTSKTADALEQIAGVHHAKFEDGVWHLAVESGKMDEVMRFLAPLGIASLVAEPPTLEDLFMQHYNMAEVNTK